MIDQSCQILPGLIKHVTQLCLYPALFFFLKQILVTRELVNAIKLPYKIQDGDLQPDLCIMLEISTLIKLDFQKRGHVVPLNCSMLSF